jgi:hypothetical protein
LRAHQTANAQDHEGQARTLIQVTVARLEPSSSRGKAKSRAQDARREKCSKKISAICDLNYTAFEGEFLSLACAIRMSAD